MVQFFPSASGFRRWLEANHATVRELWVGLYRKDSGKGGLTYPEALDEALCFGWIDGVRKKAGADSYTIRFTPRRPRSVWSRVNIRHARRLKRSGRMRAAGLKAFAGGHRARSGLYSFEKATGKLAAADEKRFRADRAAWAFFHQQPLGYRRIAIWWVLSAKRDETRVRRLSQLIEVSGNQRRLAQVTGSNGD
jgi:uncharacterized protein YdeI (YjbR/CyaY-like superfamily)